ncbi:MAG TPA: NTP transferase domain-containing protein [Thermoanaerobacterales bacterium]|mgnify:CR=1 FL=1|jgi:GTP:adenosylcobinamide-phosphate guanylyltransferase|nr:NTP transferase domain-containing protein [Thermoanaerobacterales bacterium]
MKALILAGNKGCDPSSDINENKALIKILGKEMISYVIFALKELDFIDKIAVVGDLKQLDVIKPFVDDIVEQGDSLSANILKGVQLFADDEDVLILTSDIPMITPDAIQDFVKKALRLEADFCYPVVKKEVNERKYPGVKRTYVKIKDGTFTGGNIVLVKAGVAKRLVHKAESFLAYRKKPWKLAGILGISFIFKFLIGNLSIEDLEKRVSDIFGIKARAVISPYPEIGTDVDKQSDLDLAAKVLSQGGI